MKLVRVAIDGPAGAGKSTVAKMVAKSLELPYIDSGAMYRAVTWKALNQGIELSDEAKVSELASQLQISFKMLGDKQLVLVDGEDVTEQIRSQAVTENVSKVSAIHGVRVEMVKKQQEIAKQQGVVMDGRDIGTAVIPDAEVKIFLTASLHQRTERRMQELVAKGEKINFAELEASIARRDKLDSTRDFSPLRQSQDAHLIDTTGISIQEVVSKILTFCKNKIDTNR